VLQATAGLRCGFKPDSPGPPCLSTVVGPVQARVMRLTLPRVLISTAVLLEAMWFIAPKFGSGPPSQRAQAAFHESVEHLSPASGAAFEAQLNRDVEMAGRRQLGIFALLLILDGVGIYYFWNDGTKNAMA
jgi:hypothetical protein